MSGNIYDRDGKVRKENENKNKNNGTRTEKRGRIPSTALYPLLTPQTWTRLKKNTI